MGSAGKGTKNLLMEISVLCPGSPGSLRGSKSNLPDASCPAARAGQGDANEKIGIVSPEFRGFLGGHPEGRGIIDPKTGEPAKSFGTADQRVDNPASDPNQYQEMKDDLQSVMNEIAKKCWCKLCGPDSPFKD